MTTVYFAESGNPRGTALVKPACGGQYGCVLSGDSTEAMFNMTWTTWNATEAVGHGTDKIDGCDPNCAAGKQYPVPVTVTFTKPVSVKCGSGTRQYWTRVSFSWPKGLPAALSGDGAPANPLEYSGLGSDTCG